MPTRGQCWPKEGLQWLESLHQVQAKHRPMGCALQRDHALACLLPLIQVFNLAQQGGHSVDTHTDQQSQGLVFCSLMNLEQGRGPEEEARGSKAYRLMVWGLLSSQSSQSQPVRQTQEQQLQASLEPGPSGSQMDLGQ